MFYIFLELGLRILDSYLLFGVFWFFFEKIIFLFFVDVLSFFWRYEVCVLRRRELKFEILL